MNSFSCFPAFQLFDLTLLFFNPAALVSLQNIDNGILVLLAEACYCADDLSNFF